MGVVFLVLLILIACIGSIIIGKRKNIKKAVTVGICILLICIVLFIVYAIEKNIMENEDNIIVNEISENQINENQITKNEIIENETNTIPQEMPEVNNAQITEGGVIINISGNKLEIGLDEAKIMYIVNINDNTKIKNYENNVESSLKDLKVGDSVYIEGKIEKEEKSIKNVDATKVEVCSKKKIKSEIERYLKDTYRIDGMGIEYINVDNAGKGFIIVEYIYDKFTYPIKLSVNSQTETFLGMGYHIQSNYGYILHEMCDITLDSKITDIDNINGAVKTIEYIAD